jgi:PAS domain S-box-containing protein
MMGVPNVTTGTADKKTPIAAPKAAEPYLLSFVEHLSEAVSIFDREWRYLYLNAAGFQMAQFTEKKPEEVLGHSIWELRPDLVETVCYQQFHRVVEQQVPVQFEMQQPLNGRWFEHCCYPATDGMAMLTRDITEQKDKLRIAMDDRTRAEEALRQRVEELETIMDVVPALVLVAHDPRCDTITGNKLANQVYKAVHGENLSANMASTTRRFFRDGRKLQPEELPMQQAVKGKDVRDCELEVELPSGKRVMTWGSASPLMDSQGNVRGCVGAFVDTTERKRAEQALRESEERFRAMANAIPNIAWSADAAGRVDYLNDWWYQYTGLTPEQSLGNGFLMAIHPDDVESTVQAWQKGVENGETEELECRIRRASDGSYRWHLGRGTPIRDGNGKVVRWFGTGTDIEDIKQAQARVAERETWFHTLFDTIPLSAALIDQQKLQFLQFNDAAAENLGYTREEFAQLTVWDIDPAYTIQHQQRDAQRLHSGEMVVLETKHRTKSGAVRDVVVYLRFVTMNGRLVGNCVWQDVTEKKAAEAALLRSEKLASAGRMAATVAHEINNPLEMVTNCIYLAVSDPDLSPDVKKYLATAERELRRVAHIAKRTLGFYRESARPAVVDIRTLVDEVVELYDPKFTRKDIRLKIEHNGHRAGTVAIAGEIRQVISNLLTNAIDASRPKGMVRVRTSRVTLNGCGYTRITVADAGTGIPTANQSRVFEPFFTTKKAVGTGLGLWVSSEIVHKHKGQLRLRSVEGKGTVFSVLLPDAA